MQPSIAMGVPQVFTVSDGKLVLVLESAEEGGFIVSSPLDPELITDADSLEEASTNARDADDALKVSRQKMAAEFATLQAESRPS